MVVEHRQLTNYVHGVVSRLEPPEGAGFATVSTIAADLGNTAIFSALCTGGCLHVIGEARLSDPDAMAEYFGRRHVDCLKIVPSHLDALLASSQPEDLLSCGRLVLGGEASSWRLIQRIRTLAPRCAVFNHYGPTETTVGVAAYPFSDDRHIGQSATLPIGRPLAGSQIYLLDANMKPAPIGVAGELHIGGEGLARGYMNRPSQTAERFIPNPFSAQQGARLYRTGDLAHHLPDGNVEFLGRADHQLKIRGYRIELGEIEALLRQHQSVRGAVVVPRNDGPTGTRLIAYVVAAPGQDVHPEQLRAYARESLPDYMVPAAFVFLPVIPLTKNGKIDRAALPEPDETDRQRVTVAPRTEAESRLASIWKELLGREELGVHDNFFDLGGHSLSAMQLVSRIRRGFNVELPLLAIFEAPTLEGLAARIISTAGTASGDDVPSIALVDRGAVIPASFSQERLWLFDQLQPRSSAYNVPAAVRVSGALDVQALEQAIHAVVDRHEVLRTTFGAVDGRPVQVIAARRPTRMTFVDLRQLSPLHQADSLATLVRVSAQHPFDLAQGPIWRAAVVQLGSDDHAILWNQHHISSDGWSAGVFVREVSELYSSNTRGVASSLAPLTVQYADFSQWQRSWLEGRGLERQLAYWKSRLEGVPASLALPADRPRPAMPSYRGGAESVVLTPELSKALTALGREEGTTMYMTLLTALNALLYLHTGQTDVVVGSPAGGRSQAETEGLIGFFLNTLALRTSVTGEVSFRELLKRVREGVLGAFAHQDLPFERVVEELKVERDKSRPVLYQVMFNHQKASEQRLSLDDLRLTQIAAAEATSKFDLTLYAHEATEQVALRMAYNTDIFDASTVAALLGRFVVLLQGIVSDPDRKVSALQLLKEEERKPRHAVGLPAAASSPAFSGFDRADVESTIHGRFEQQAARYPESIAVKTRRYEWTYRQLDAEATRVASMIQARAGDQITRVGLLFESDAPLLAGILGALKAGHTYVPLDPSNPQDRLAYMLKHSEASVLLADAANLPLARELADGAVDVLEIEGAAGAQQAFRPARPATPDSIAYILYTSGSTGVPKGVVQNHRNVLHFMRVYTNNLRIRHGDRLSLLSSYGFDGAVMDIFGALLSGATLLPARLMDEGLDGVLKRIVDDRVTVFHSTPTVFRQLFSGKASAGALQHVRTVVLGGEEALTSDLNLFKSRFAHDAVFVNGLGPSESTVTLQHFMDGSSTNTRTSLPVGFPVDETEVVLLDADGGRTDVYGEIGIESPYVALGYWRDDEKSRAAFRATPDESGRRLYRTGDMGRRLPDGTLEFLGRRDTQVKVRGFRIELGEVESVLGGHPDVDESAVLARTDGGGSTRLIAYVRPSIPRDDLAPSLRAFLQQKLPEYMIPSAFVVQASLPLTPNGKLDRRALPDVVEQPEAKAEFIAPRTAVERKLAGLWTEVLGLKQVGALDDFFSVGGHSLHAMRLVSRIRGAFEIELPLRILFESPTLEGMSAHVERATGADSSQENRLAAITAVDRSGDLPLSFAQQRMWILDQLEPGGSTYNVPAAVELDGPLHLASLDQAIQAIVARHEVLRTTFDKSPVGEPMQVISAATGGRLPIVDLSTCSLDRIEQVVDSLALREATRPFDLSTGPLLRVVILRVATEKHVVLFTMHHVVSDAWSTGVLVRELSELYQAFAAGRGTSLQPLAIQYADYAAWQRRWLEGEVLQKQIGYWKSQLDGAPESLNLPLDRPRGSDVTYNGAREEFVLPAHLVSRLSALSRSEGTTLFVSLLAAFQALLRSYTGQNDIVVGTPVAGRNGAETEPLIGFFVNTLVLRSRVNPMASFREFVRDVHDTVLDATAHQDVPFERLVDELQPDRGAGHTPLFQVAFVFQNAPREALAMSELTLRNRPVETGTSKFDWGLSLAENGEQVTGHFEYNTDLFDRETVRRVIGHYEHLLGAAVADPDELIGELPLLTEGERAAVVEGWNATGAPYPAGSMAAVFEAQAAQTPDAVALVAGPAQWTYAGVNRRANQLAHYLRRMGVGAETPVGVYLERTPELVIAQVALLKCGAVYVPLDPAYPERRLRFQAADAGIAVLITATAEAVPFVDAAVRVLALAAADTAVAAEPATNPVGGAGPETLAYVVYTSGSTGVPKGVEVPHRGVLRLLFGGTYATLGPGTVVAHHSSPTFDASTFEVWAPLLHGGRCVLYPDRVPTPRQLAAAVARDGLTTMWLTAALFNTVVDEAPAGLRGLAELLIGGEALSVAHVRRALAAMPGTTIINGYGPTESTTFTCCYRIAAERVAPRGSVPIGRPIGNTTVYMLDPQLQPAPVGVSGELYIGGAGLARGYLGRADLTAERFVPAPYAGEPGQRLYRTGDMARYLPDGLVEFQGRVDHQVKIRGFRIELGEIEAALVAHGGARDAVVLAREDVPGDKRLVAYVVPASPEGFSMAEARAELDSRLPAYMVPSAFVSLTELPLSPNGKVDRGALPPPERASIDQPTWDDEPDASFAPSTEAEISIARIWQDVLGLDDIGAHDKFFDLGGHSLNAIQVMTRIERELGFEVEFNDLVFQTLRQIAAVCERQETGGASLG